MEVDLGAEPRSWLPRVVFAIAVLLPFILAYPTSGQSVKPDDIERQEFSGTVEVRLGTIYVSVLDAKNRAVTGLNPADFTLFVNGEQIEITNFTEVQDETSIPKTESSEPQPERHTKFGEVVATETPPQPRLLAVVVDNDNITVFHRNHLIKRAKEFIENGVQPPRLGMVLTNERYPKVLCPPTTNSGEAIDALNGLLDTASGAAVNQAAIRFVEDRISQPQYGGGGIRTEQAVSLSRMTAYQLDDSLKRSVETLKTVFRALGGFEGKKDVLYISDGLPMTPGEELFRLIELTRPSARYVLNELHNFYRAPLFEELANQAIAADVTLHTIDARGLITEHDTPADRRSRMPVSIGYVKAQNYQEPLRYLSAQTGGLAIVNTNRFRQGLARIEEAMTTYYSLGFRLGQRAEDRVHSIRIELPNYPDHKMRYRRQFFERSQASLVADQTMTGLLVNPVRNDLDMRISVEMVTPQTADTWNGKIAVEIPSLHLAAARGTESTSADLSIFSVSSSEKGRSPLSRTEVVVDLPPDRDADVELQINLELDAGFNRISVGVLDEAGGMAGFAVAEKTVVN